MAGHVLKYKTRDEYYKRELNKVGLQTLVDTGNKLSIS